MTFVLQGYRTYSNRRQKTSSSFFSTHRHYTILEKMKETVRYCLTKLNIIKIRFGSSLLEMIPQEQNEKRNLNYTMC